MRNPTQEAQQLAAALVNSIERQQAALVTQLRQLDPASPPDQIKALLDRHLMLSQALAAIQGILAEPLEDEETAALTLGAATRMLEEVSALSM